MSSLELGPGTVVDYLRDRDVLPAGVTPDVRTLGGGVSNHVVRVAWDERCLVCKQPLPNLAVEDDWPADVERVHNEASATRAYADAIGAAGLDDVRVPEVVFEDADAHVIGIECAPDDARMWKADLLDGVVETRVARTVGRVLGTVHARAPEMGVREAFASKRPFVQLRVDPYHRTTAERHPEVADEIRVEADRVLSVDRTLVHGDYSPKNVLVGPEAWILDFEVAHWGDPAFDTGFMCNHLFIKSVYNHEHMAAYHDAVRTFWSAYREAGGFDVERETVAELGVLMLARVDGKSPVEYVTREATKAALRDVARSALRGEVETLDGFAARCREESPA
ncbi:MAG: phosphotransferase family protein [Halobacteriaceae archaeon]